LHELHCLSIILAKKQTHKLLVMSKFVASIGNALMFRLEAQIKDCQELEIKHLTEVGKLKTT
jgi:hypothetical protein